jgi:Kelch motif
MVGWVGKGPGKWLATLVFCSAAVGLSTAWAQSGADPNGGLYEQLDEQWALGMGRTGPPVRAVARERTGGVPESEHVDPQTREEYRRNQEDRFRRHAEREDQERRVALDTWNAEIRAQCGEAPLETAKVGMSVDRFEQCGPEIRFGGGLTHRISLQLDGRSARLYVFAEGKVHRVYVVDGVVTRVEPHPLHVVQETLPKVGQYPPLVFDPQVVALSQGHFFAYGPIRGEDWREPPGENLKAWGQPRGRIANQSLAPPFMWDAQKQGWVRLEAPPACEGLWHQHTLTALADDRVLVAGGLCDIPRFLNDMGTFEPQSGTALWDARQRTWLPAPALEQPRIHHTASLLGGISVMLVGGFDDPLITAAQAGSTQPAVRALGSVELFTGDRMVRLPSLLHARAKHAATVMASGSVLVTGGVGTDLQAMGQVEVWDAGQQRWVPRAPMRTARYGHAATLLTDGRVLVSGGIDAREVALHSTELYDPATDRWTDGPPLPTHLQGHASLLLSDGRVLLAGGLVAPPPLGPWLHSWHPSDKAWRAEGVREQGSPERYSHLPALSQIASDQVLAFGGNGVYLYRMGASGLEATGATSAAPIRFPDEWWKAGIPVAAERPVAASSPPSGRLERLLTDLWQARAALGVLAAGLLAVWLAWQWWSRYRPAGPVGPSRSSGWVPWLARGLIYGGLVLVAGPHVITYFALQTNDMNDECRARPSTCLDADTRLLERQWAVPGRSKFSGTRIPCAFVGTWATGTGSREFLIRLNADGTYGMTSQAQGIPGDSGHWAVQGGYMLWRSGVQAGAEMDINRIVANDGQHLELVEGDGRHSHFERRADLPLMRCVP